MYPKSRVITIHVILCCSGIECDEDIPTVEPPDDNPALFLMPDRTSKELPPLNRVPSGSSPQLIFYQLFYTVWHNKFFTILPDQRILNHPSPAISIIFDEKNILLIFLHLILESSR